MTNVLRLFDVEPQHDCDGSSPPPAIAALTVSTAQLARYARNLSVQLVEIQRLLQNLHDDGLKVSLTIEAQQRHTALKVAIGTLCREVRKLQEVSTFDNARRG